MGRGVSPLKRLSQNFLKDETSANRMVDSLKIAPEDTILEIGPGEGVLTERLMQSPASRLIAVEVDERLFPILKHLFGSDSRFSLVEQSFLNCRLDSFCPDGGKLRIIGNLPYAITSPILFHILGQRQWVSDVTVTIQKEVGERLSSPPGCKAYGVPSVLFQSMGSVETLLSISRKAFYPVPAVDSVVVRISFSGQPMYDIRDFEFFTQVVRTVFTQRRKMLRNSVKPLIPDQTGDEINGISLKRRPESLSVQEFADLTRGIEMSLT